MIKPLKTLSLFALMLAFAAPAQAKIRVLSVAERVKAADTVILGVVSDIKDADEPGATGLKIATIKLSGTIKGKNKYDSKFTLVYMTKAPCRSIHLEKDKSYLFFLKKNKDHYRAVNHSFGAILVAPKNANYQKTYKETVKVTKKLASVCPHCKSAKAVIPIIYGKPGSSLIQKSKEGKVRLGGCKLSWDAPRHHCKTCKKQW